MPSVSSRQRRFMGAELGRKRRGEKTITSMNTQQLREFAGKVKKHRGRERRARKRGT